MTAELKRLADRDRIVIEEATHQDNPDGWIVMLATEGSPPYDGAYGRTRQMPYVGAARPGVVDILRQMLDFAAESDPRYRRRQSFRLPALAADVDPQLVHDQASTDMRLLLGDSGYAVYMRASGHDPD